MLFQFKTKQATLNRVQTKLHWILFKAEFILQEISLFTTWIFTYWSDISTKQASENFLIRSLDEFSLENEIIKLHNPMSFLWTDVK